jgi:protein disulfide-isomerase
VSAPQKKLEAVWLTDFEEAKKLAKKEKKAIFIDFSGSDWCHWCVKLDNEVFAKSEFVKYASENLVLFLADFPRANQQSAKVKNQNQLLMKKYGVRGFPTIVILNSDGEKVSQMSYQPGGAAKYVESIKSNLTK